MGLYTKKGLYSGYDKKHKERDALDYYSTPTEEVENILTEMNIPLDDVKILEPCCGGGHMLKGIENYCAKKHFYPTIFATDVQKRTDDPKIESGLKYDFLDDDYPYTDVDYVIMNNLMFYDNSRFINSFFLSHLSHVRDITIQLNASI